MPDPGVGFALMHVRKYVVAPDYGGCPGHARLASRFKFIRDPERGN